VQEWPSASGLIAHARLLDLDNFGTKVCKQSGAIGPGSEAAKLYNLKL
jgi:hypothetical protein